MDAAGGKHCREDFRGKQADGAERENNIVWTVGKN